MPSGFVALVGAGPGHADFLTLAAVRHLQAADCILYDALLDQSILAYFPRRAKRHFVGKRCGQHSLTQVQIEEKLIEEALKGQYVVRLKGGDPFVFGRGAEEITSLQRHGIPFEVVAGVSAINGVAAQLGLPLTHRHHANEFRVLQGHRLPEEEGFWPELARYRGTICFYMAYENREDIVHRLLQAGAPWDLPLLYAESEAGKIKQAFLTSLGAEAKQAWQKSGQGPVIIYLGENCRQLAKTSYLSSPAECDHVPVFANFS